jgi:hypothetical protein
VLHVSSISGNQPDEWFGPSITEEVSFYFYKGIIWVFAGYNRTFSGHACIFFNNLCGHFGSQHYYLPT